jgi:hypothetical protein
MSKTMYMQVGSSDVVSLPELITSLRSFLRILRDFDASL